jgi:hypothetical protein
METEAFWLFCAKLGVPTDQIRTEHQRAWHALSAAKRALYREELCRVIGAHISTVLRAAERLPGMVKRND